MPVDAAIVDGPTAAEKPTMQFMGLGDQYWGFRVARESWEHPQKVTYDVPTKSLRDLAVRPAPEHCQFVCDRARSCASRACVGICRGARAASGDAASS